MATKQENLEAAQLILDAIKEHGDPDGKGAAAVKRLLSAIADDEHEPPKGKPFPPPFERLNESKAKAPAYADALDQAFGVGAHDPRAERGVSYDPRTAVQSFGVVTDRAARSQGNARLSREDLAKIGGSFE